LAERLNTPLQRLGKVLSRMKNFDPAGVFARDLAECLALQLKDKNRLDPAMQALLDNLPLLAMHDYKKLQKLCGVDEADLKDMIAEIKALNPRPAAAFDHFISQTAVPDVLMKRLPKEMGGGFGVELNADTLPRVLVNQKYYTEVLKSAHHKADKEYLSAHMQSANWLIRALDQRAQTILKVAAEIIERQEAFFLYGVEYLKPMILKDIADAIGMHESTISRVTMGKFIGTPRGLFELKYFFQSGVGSADGASTYAAHAVKSRIKAFVDSETHAHVLSDDDLVERLTAEGIEIARRTVAKYREAMGIPSSVQRRRLLKQKA
jgi:RNA polymerase sigma-54 factor